MTVKPITIGYLPRPEMGETEPDVMVGTTKELQIERGMVAEIGERQTRDVEAMAQLPLPLRGRSRRG